MRFYLTATLLFTFVAWLGYYMSRVWRTRFIIHDKAGSVYLVRYFLLGGLRSENNWLSRLLRNRKVYLHQIIRSDSDRALHDHPWGFTSVMLWGKYREVVDGKQLPGESHQESYKRRKAGWEFFGFHEFIEYARDFRAPCILRRPASWRHRLILPEGKTTWTLVFVGPKERQWGFWPAWNKWCYWRNYDTGTGLCEEPEVTP